MGPGMGIGLADEIGAVLRNATGRELAEIARAVDQERTGRAVLRERDDSIHETAPSGAGSAPTGYPMPRDQHTAATPNRLGPLALRNVDDAFRYQPWDGEQTDRGNQVRDALVAAAKVILRVVPESASRTRALNNLMDARMLANQSISFRGWL